jgi:hypothetical protein
LCSLQNYYGINGRQYTDSGPSSVCNQFKSSGTILSRAMSISAIQGLNQSKCSRLYKSHLVVHLQQESSMAATSDGQILTFIEIFVNSQCSGSMLAVAESTSFPRAYCYCARRVLHEEEKHTDLGMSKAKLINSSDRGTRACLNIL